MVVWSKNSSSLAPFQILKFFNADEFIKGTPGDRIDGREERVMKHHRILGTIAPLAVSAFLALGALSSCEGKTQRDGEGFGKKVAGTYLAVQKEASQILQIRADGTFSIISSIQFSGGVLSEPFSTILGSWKKIEPRQITARMVDIVHKPDGTFFGTASGTYVMRFDEEFQVVDVTCEGAIFLPGVNPLDPVVAPIPVSDFTCDAINYRRLWDSNS